MRKISIKFAAVFVLSVVMVSCTGCSTIRKAYWDSKVDELCKKDGGVVIYEKVVILKIDYPNVKLSSTGILIHPFENEAKSTDPFYLTSETEYLKSGYLDVMRHKQSIVRNLDKKVLGTYTSYGRRGGDSWINLWAHPSSHSCKGDDVSLREYSSIVTINGD